MVYFQAVHNEWKDKGVALLMINIGEDAGEVRNFIESNGHTFPVLLDSQYEVAGKYGVRFTPTTSIVDKAGNLQSKTVGAFTSKSSIEKKFRDLLN